MPTRKDGTGPTDVFSDIICFTIYCFLTMLTGKESISRSARITFESSS